MLTEKQKEMIDYYYNDDLSLSEIADNLGITRQGVRDSIKRAETQLFEMEDRLHMVQRYNEIQDGLEMICEAAAKIADYNSKMVFAFEIDQQVKTIIETAQKLNEYRGGKGLAFEGLSEKLSGAFRRLRS